MPDEGVGPVKAKKRAASTYYGRVIGRKSQMMGFRSFRRRGVVIERATWGGCFAGKRTFVAGAAAMQCRVTMMLICKMRRLLAAA